MYISIDIGGSKTRIAFSRNLSTLEDVVKHRSPRTITELKNLIVDSVSNYSGEGPFLGISVGVPGIVDSKNGKIIKAPNYSELDNLEVDFFQSIFEPDTPIYLNNDASLACLGEAVSGAGKSYKSVAYLTLSTGVGGALVYNRKLSESTKSSEPGHHVVNFVDSQKDKAGIAGSLESYLSGTGFKERYKMAPEDCTSEAIWSEYGQVLGAGILNLSVFWSPEVVVLGGSVAVNKYDSFIHSTLNYLRNTNSMQTPEIRKSLLEDDAGLVGGFVYLQQKLS